MFLDLMDMKKMPRALHDSSNDANLDLPETLGHLCLLGCLRLLRSNTTR